MRTINLLFLLTFISVVNFELNGQISKEEYDEKVISNYKLKLKVSALEDTIKILKMHIESIQKDSIKLYNKKPELARLEELEQENAKLRKDTNGRYKLENDYKDASAAIASYEATYKDTVGLHNLKNYKEDIATLNKSLNKKTNDIALLNDSLRNYQIRENSLNKNINDLRAIVREKYNRPLTIIVQSTTIQGLEADKNLIGLLNFSEFELDNINNMIEALLLYKKSELILSQKYNKQYTELTVNLLKEQNQKDFYSGLIHVLENYNTNSEALRSLITSIQKLNSIPTGGIRDLEKERKSEIFVMIEDYVYLYEIDLTKYIYLNQIISELKARKMQNLEAEVRDLLLKT